MVPAAWLIGVIFSLQVPPPPPATTPTSELRRERQAIRDEETKQLKALADRVKREGKTAAFEEITRYIGAPRPADGATRFVPLADVVPARAKGLANVPAKGAAPEPWRSDLRAIRETAAKSLFTLAGRAASSAHKHYALADECLRAVLARQPDHAEARRLLGYVPRDGGWATQFADQQLRRGKVLHPTFGWVDGDWVPHLEQGELPAPPTRVQKQVQWLPAAQADELHRPWESHWKIPTQHFLIHTNVPLSEAILFGRQLEAFHDLFFALLADLFAADNRLPLAQRYQNKAMVGEKTTELHQVYYFATKAEFVEFLRQDQGPGIEKCLGLYVPPKRGKKRAPAYFFRDPDGQVEASATLYHEVSHQLLFETAGPNAHDKNVGNFWVFEGLGTYFETLVTEPGGTLQVGGLVGPRIDEAQRRLLDEHEFIPIETMVRFGKNEFNRDETVHLHYAEAIALAVFLMQAEGAKYREPFLDYVKDAYQGRLKVNTGRSLEERLGVSYDALDTQFLAYLKGR